MAMNASNVAASAVIGCFIWHRRRVSRRRHPLGMHPAPSGPAVSAVLSGIDALQDVCSAVAPGSQFHERPSLACPTEGLGLLLIALLEPFGGSVKLVLKALHKVRLQLGNHLCPVSTT